MIGLSALALLAFGAIEVQQERAYRRIEREISSAGTGLLGLDERLRRADERLRRIDEQLGRLPAEVGRLMQDHATAKDDETPSSPS